MVLKCMLGLTNKLIALVTLKMKMLCVNAKPSMAWLRKNSNARFRLNLEVILYVNIFLKKE